MAARPAAASALLGALALVSAAPTAHAATPPSVGERIYRDGVLPSGKPLHGQREGGGAVDGAYAACATCHRRSGLGSWEGQTVVPPIIGRYLFRAGARNVEDPELPHVQGYVPHRGPYTEATLARAIRSGVDQTGRKLSYLMPRYSLDDAAMASLIAYLKTLTSGSVPGVSGDTLHFATIITPDADPVATGGMLAVLRQFFADKNSGHGGYRGVTPPLQSTRGVMYRVNRKWQLHVWELTGPPESWQAQLEAHLRATPVFAIVSGIGGKTWGPVHAFCQRESIPCLFPNVDLPVVAESDFYPVYFHQGVLLEAALIADKLVEARDKLGLRRLVQIYREGDIGAAAAQALAKKLAPAGYATEARPLGDGDARARLAAALAGVGRGDVVVLWLRGADLSALPATPPSATLLFASGLMGGMEQTPLPSAWRASTRLTYPLNLPELRQVQMNFPRGWFNVRHIAVVAERVQTDTYLACVILSETIGHMLDSFVRDFLVERVEVLLDHRLVNAHYPRLGLAPGQRFASKGGYLVRLLPSGGTRVIADSEWIVP